MMPFPAESTNVEYKRQIDDGKKIVKTAVAFLNTGGGTLHVGVDDDGGVVGLSDPDGDQIRLGQILKDQLSPSCLGLFDIFLMRHSGKTLLRLVIVQGPEQPYHIRTQGMSERGCFIRVGSANEPMPLHEIESRFARREGREMVAGGRAEAPYCNLTSMTTFPPETDLSFRTGRYVRQAVVPPGWRCWPEYPLVCSPAARRKI